MKDDESAAMQRIEQAFATAGLKVPLLKEVLASLAIDHARAQKLVTLLLRDKVLVKLSDDLVFHRAALDALRLTMQQFYRPDGDIMGVELAAALAAAPGGGTPVSAPSHRFSSPQRRTTCVHGRRSSAL